MGQICYAILQLVPKWAILPLVEVPLLCILHVVFERSLQPGGDGRIDDPHRDLIVQLKRSIVEVRRSDARPLAVHDEDLLMEQRSLVLEHADATLQQSPEIVMAGVLDDRTV